MAYAVLPIEQQPLWPLKRLPQIVFKQWRVAFAFVLVIIAIAIVRQVVLACGPFYHGRSLGSWLQQEDRAIRFTARWPIAHDPEARAAILAMGTNSLPHLLHALTNTDLGFYDALRGSLSRYLRVSLPPPPRYQGAAAAALAILGPTAKPTVPVLAQELNSASPHESDYLVAHVLGEIGPDGWTALTKALASTNFWAQTTPSEDARLALRGFTLLGKQARPVFAALIELTQGPNQSTRHLAYGCVRRLKLPWEAVWPALIPALHNDSRDLRIEAAEFLWREYSDEATRVGLKPFVPPFGIVQDSEP